MSLPGRQLPLRNGAIRWSALVFLVVFTVLLIVIATYVLVPGFEAARDPKITPQEKRSLAAWYRLLLIVLLFILFAGLVLTFRFGRLFFPRATAPRTQTRYVDAWAESGRRLQLRDEESDSDERRDDDDDDQDDGEEDEDGNGRRT